MGLLVAALAWLGAAALAFVIALTRLPATSGPDTLVWDALVWPALVLVLGAVVQVISRRRPARGIPMAAAVAIGWATLYQPAEARPDHAAPDLMLGTLDTVRADQAGTPELLGLAATGTTYSNAVTTAPLTAPAHASMLTGLAPPEHGLTANGDVVAATSIVEVLSDAGYRTAAFLSSKVLERHTGLDAGFDLYADVWTRRGRQGVFPGVHALLGAGGGERRGDHTVEQALAWWAATEGPRFAWVHLYDVHAPYAPPEGWGPDEETRQRVKDEARSTPAPASGREWMETLPTRHAASQKALYASEMAWTDHLVGRLMDGIEPETVVIVVADHGEGFGEHDDAFEHGRNLFEPVMHVPLIVRWPGKLPRGGEDERLTSVQAVAGVLAEAGDVAWTGPGLATSDTVLAYTPGQSSRPAMDGAEPEPLASIRHATSKIVMGVDGEAQRYDLMTDPDEETVIEARGADVERLRALHADPPEPLDERAAKRLEALGYF